MNPAAQAPSSAEIEALSSAFASFGKVTEELRSSYERLRERAEKIDVELALANEQLREKVGELDHLTRHLNGILTAIPSGVVVSDAEGRISAWNAAAEKILGLRSADALGRKVAEIRDAEGKALLLGGEASPEKTPGGRERRGADGRRIALGGGVSALRDGEGRRSGSVEVVEDLTEIWDLRERIHRLDKLAALGEMAAVIAHEIRNPLNGVQGFADLIAKQLASSDPKLSNYAASIVRGVREVDSIIADLLAFASPERFSPTSVDLAAVLERARNLAVESLSAERAAKLQIQTELPPNGIRLAGDAVKLGQIFRNLFSNAIEAMPNGGRIRVGARIEGDRAAVSVADEGPGIPEEIRAKIFDPFFTTKTQGTGLGLAIVRKLVELHGGKASLGKAAKGARFELTLPAIP